MDHSQSNKKPWKILLAATGSVASIKVVQLATILMEKAEVRILLTESSKKFIDQMQLQELKVECYEDKDEKECWNKRGDPVLHVELRKWADAMIIAPLSANTLAKIANGFCDTLVTLVCRCWDMNIRDLNKNTKKLQAQQSQSHFRPLQKPMLVCPAMNTMMWDHPITSQHLTKLRSWGFIVVDPVEKVLVCGDSGKGAMASLETIAESLFNELLFFETHKKTN